LSYSKAMNPPIRSQAFTVMELLVVVAVIAVLAAILLPVLAQARERGRQIKCLNHENQITIAAILYADDNDGNMCGERMGSESTNVWPAPPKPNHGKAWTWSFAILPYTAGSTNGQGDLWACPTRPPNWNASAEEVDDTVISSYGIAEDTFWGDYGSRGIHSCRITSISKPAQTILFGETCWSGPGISARFLDWTNNWIGYWHARRCNFAFWDGHGEPLRAVTTVTDSPDECMWGHSIWPHSVHITARNQARSPYRRGGH
jgi:prepilin-type N-terminal cleavage/methylation domain-containing protein/prepilin-type processing-associated H-X9-DG protein